MALPEGGLSSTYVVAPYAEFADSRKWESLRDWEMGGTRLNYPNDGLRAVEWTVEYYNGKVYISTPAVPGRTTLFAMTGIREISLAFDSNMSPFVAYMKEVGGEIKYESWYWWFDATIPGFTHVKLPDFSYYPKCCLDDKRTLAQNLQQQHIVLAYIRDSKLYVRQQIDRFVTETLLWNGFRVRLNKIGMNLYNRLQFQLSPLPPE